MRHQLHFGTRAARLCQPSASYSDAEFPGSKGDTIDSSVVGNADGPTKLAIEHGDRPEPDRRGVLPRLIEEWRPLSVRRQAAYLANYLPYGRKGDNSENGNEKCHK